MTTTLPEPYLCIKPACGNDCSGCNKAISAQTMRDYAIAHAAALAAPQPEPWMPIETAPKDGSEMLLSNGETVAQGHWLHAEAYIREKRDADGRYIDQEESDGFDGWIDYIGGMLPEPTHWMPLPAAPGAAPPAAPAPAVPADAALNTLAKMFHNGEEVEGDDGAAMMVDMALWNEGCEALESLIGDGNDETLASPAAPAVPVSWDRLRILMDGIPTREEFIGGQRQKYVAKEAVMSWLHEGQLRAEREAAQPAAPAVQVVLRQPNLFASAPAVPLTDTRKLCTCDGAGRGPGRACVVQAGGRLGELWKCAKSAAPAVREPKPAELLGMAVVDAIVDDGMRNAAGGIYATRVQEFAREVQIAFAQQNRVDLSGIGGGGNG